MLQAELLYLRGRLEQREERFVDARTSLLGAAALTAQYDHVELAPAAWTHALMVDERVDQESLKLSTMLWEAMARDLLA